MRLVIQKVSQASCTVDNHITGKIDTGYMVLVGFGLQDDEAVVEKMAEKMSKLRIFDVINVDVVARKTTKHGDFCVKRFAVNVKIVARF